MYDDEIYNNEINPQDFIATMTIIGMTKLIKKSITVQKYRTEYPDIEFELTQEIIDSILNDIKDLEIEW